MAKYVYDFSEGNKDMKDLLGGKGANLAEMTNMGLAVPPGFTITTEACLTYLAGGEHPAGLLGEIAHGAAANLQRRAAGLHALEVEDVVDEADEAVGVGDGDAEEVERFGVDVADDAGGE